MKSLPDDLYDGYYTRPGLTLEERLAARLRERSDQSLAGLLLESAAFGRVMTFVVAVAGGVLFGGLLVALWRR